MLCRRGNVYLTLGVSSLILVFVVLVSLLRFSTLSVGAHLIRKISRTINGVVRTTNFNFHSRTPPLQLESYNVPLPLPRNLSLADPFGQSSFQGVMSSPAAGFGGVFWARLR